MSVKMRQNSLFAEPAPDLPQRFRAFIIFHLNNPEVYRLFSRYAEQALNARRGRTFGARMIFERMRWYVSIETVNADGFKLSNNHIPYYSRLLMAVDERFAGFFDTVEGQFDATAEDIADVAAGRYGLNDDGELILSPTSPQNRV